MQAEEVCHAAGVAVRGDKQSFTPFRHARAFNAHHDFPAEELRGFKQVDRQTF